MYGDFRTKKYFFLVSFKMMLTELKAKIGELLEAANLPKDRLLPLLEAPKRSGHGHLALPVFILAKEKKSAPPVVAQDLAKLLKNYSPDWLADVRAESGFVNFFFSSQYVQKLICREVKKHGEGFGNSDLGKGRTMVIDYSSPNVAKPMHIGHLRATVIGQAIVNLAKSQGYKVVGLNHLGDWGVQFGNLAWAYVHWGKEYDLKVKPFAAIYAMYVRFHQEAENNPELARAGAEMFKRLEDGDPEVEKIWKLVVDMSLAEYGRLWDLLGVQHDLVRGESFYNERMKVVEESLEKKGLLVESEGAMVVRLDEEGIAPCLIRKQDGASLYATRDLASAIYRREELKADLNLYVVGAEQTLHFRQVFKVLEKMGYDWVNSCHHISFGMYRFKDEGKMSSREGKVILLEDVLGKAESLVKDIIAEKNPNLENRDLVARQVGIGAVIFNDLQNDRVKNVEFDWQSALSFEGDSGPYVQYCVVRCKSILKKANRPILDEMPENLDSNEEVELLRHLLNFPDVVSSSFQHFKPHILAGYLLDVCRLFGQFYTHQRVMGVAEGLENSRLKLVQVTELVLRRGLSLLNIQSPDSM